MSWRLLARLQAQKNNRLRTLKAIRTLLPNVRLLRRERVWFIWVVGFRGLLHWISAFRAPAVGAGLKTGDMSPGASATRY